MCDLHEAAERLRAEQRAERFENRFIAAMVVVAALLYAFSLAGYLQ